MCSLERTGSILFSPTNPSNAVTVLAIFSLSISRFFSQGIWGACRDARNAYPESLHPNQVCKSQSGLHFAETRIRSRPISHWANPLRQKSAASAAACAIVFPDRRASSGLTHGRKSAGSSSGKWSKVLVISPLGSIIKAGKSLRQPLPTDQYIDLFFPKPVIPTTTACVVKSSGSSKKA